MDSLRVDICYRPLRIGWAIKAGDMDAFRAAARISFALWGGRFNPIIVVDQQEQAKALIDGFRVDFIMPLGTSRDVHEFPDRFPHLRKPFLSQSVFVGDAEHGAVSEVLDIQNALVHHHDKPDWKLIQESGLRFYKWEPDDPLADVLLIQFGAYPGANDIHIDYRALLEGASKTQEVRIDYSSRLPADLFEHPNISFVSRYGLREHYRQRRGGWSTPGFFSGDASNFDDLICFWNLRAADIRLLFVDVGRLDRYGETIPAWSKIIRDMVSHERHAFERRVAVWFRDEEFYKTAPQKIEEITAPFKGEVSTVCPVGDGLWNGLNICPPTMYLDETSTLGAMSAEAGRLRISFSLDKKPFSDDVWFHNQHLVASLSFLSGLYGDEQNTLAPPFVPELNEFYSRTMHYDYRRVRSEPYGIGLTISACDKTDVISPMPVADLVEQIFNLAGFRASLSAGGLIARQLIAQLGGVDGARAFKIPGVRRLLRTHGPRAAFTKKSALELIGGKDPENATASFRDYQSLYIAQRPRGTKLDPEMVFTYLVEKGLFRIGAELNCPHCRISSWTALDALKQRLVCEMCGREFDATRQLVRGIWHYRRSGVLGTERHAQGAVPVVLTLQQFKANLGGLNNGMYSPSVDLVPKEDLDLPRCELDFVWLIPQPYPEKTVIMIGECKDQGQRSVDATDIDHLRRVADALPRERFLTYIVLAKLCPFSSEEIALAKTLNDQYRRRAILLTARELEPYHFYERTKIEFKQIKEYASRPEDMAISTAYMYFKE